MRTSEKDAPQLQLKLRRCIEYVNEEDQHNNAGKNEELRAVRWRTHTLVQSDLLSTDQCQYNRSLFWYSLRY